MKSSIGGMTSLRGYPEAIASGDAMNQASLEYIVHIPRMFPEKKHISSNSFKFRPDSEHGPIDWDLALKTFVDAGMVKKTRAQTHELDHVTLYDAGLGISLSVLDTVMTEGTWGYALKGFPYQGVKKGNQEWYFNCTLRY